MAIPVKMVSIEMNGAVTDVSTFVQCKSANEDIVKVPWTSFPRHNPFTLPPAPPVGPALQKQPQESIKDSFCSSPCVPLI